MVEKNQIASGGTVVFAPTLFIAGMDWMSKGLASQDHIKAGFGLVMVLVAVGIALKRETIKPEGKK